MKVFKFGGASVKSAAAVKNLVAVLKHYHKDNIWVVISAMGKTTNSLEDVVNAYFNNTGEALAKLDAVKKFHYAILDQLFSTSNSIYQEVNNLFVEIEWAIEDEPQRSYDFEYDQIVSMGELLSTKIVSAYLNKEDVKNQWVDSRDFIKTDNTYREAKIDWQLSAKTFSSLRADHNISVTQGFIGCTSENFTTTLGREGSDFSAAIIAYLADAESVTIWKDVPGMLNADPKWFDETKKLNHISYLEAVELAYYGATVIHPKTIKPLQNKGITLLVKSFLEPENEGTVINESTASDSLMPSFIFRMNQVLISISAKDYSFIMEDNLSNIFALFHQHKVKINLMQNSAISFSVSIDNEDRKLKNLINHLRKSYNVRFNKGLELVTIRHYDQQTIDKVVKGKQILVEQKSRNTARMVMKTVKKIEL